MQAPLAARSSASEATADINAGQPGQRKNMNVKAPLTSVVAVVTLPGCGTANMARSARAAPPMVDARDYGFG